MEPRLLTDAAGTRRFDGLIVRVMDNDEAEADRLRAELRRLTERI